MPTETEQQCLPTQEVLRNPYPDYLDESTIGIKRTYEYDADGNVIKETELEGNYKTYEYDAKGRNTAIRYFDESGAETMKTVYTYNSMDEITLAKDYERSGEEYTIYRSTAYEYDALKRLISYTEWNGEENAPKQPDITYSYDINDNLTKIRYADKGSSLASLEYEYDSAKRLVKIKADTGGLLKDTVREYEYDLQGRVALIKDYYDFTENNNYLAKHYTYDSFGRVTSMAYRDGATDEIKEAYIYTYDKNSNIVSERIVSNYVTDDTGAGTDITREYTYDALGRLIKSEESDGITEGGQPEVTEYTYDNVGNRLTESKPGEQTSYTYNGLNQLTSSVKTGAEAERRTYTCDENGNQISETTDTGRKHGI